MQASQSFKEGSQTLMELWRARAGSHKKDKKGQKLLHYPNEKGRRSSNRSSSERNMIEVGFIKTTGVPKAALQARTTRESREDLPVIYGML